MSTIDINILAKHIELYPNGSYVNVDLADVDTDEVLAEVGRKEIVEWDTVGLLDEMGTDTIINYLTDLGYTIAKGG